jgi:hypothetical protein
VAEEKVKLTFEADVASFKKTVQQIPGITQKEVDKMVNNYTKGLKKIDTSTVNTAKGAKKLADALGFGDKAGKIENLADSIGLIGPAGIAGAAGLAAVAVSVGGVLAVAAGVKAFAEYVSAATAETEKLARPLALISGMEIISAGSIAAAAEYQLQLSTLDTVSSGFAQVLVDEMSPAMSNAAAIATGASIEMLQLAKSTQTATDAFTAAYPVVSDMLAELASTVAIGGTGQAMIGLANDLGVATGAWEHFAEVGHGATKAIVDDKIALDDWEAAKKRNDKADDALLEKTKRVNEAIGREQVAALKAVEAEWGRHVDAINKMIDAGYADRVRDETADWYARLDAVDAATKKTADMWSELDTLIDREDTLTTSTDRVNDALGAQAQLTGGQLVDAFGGALDVVSTLTDAVDTLAAAEQARHEQAIEGLRDERAGMIEKYKAAGTLYTADAQAAIKGQTDKIKAERKAAKQAYAAQKAMAITGIAISSAQAAIAMLANPAIALIPPPGNVLAAAGIAAAAGLAQTAAVLATPAPKFHGGRAAPDETPATLTKTESVLTGRGTAAVGGAAGVNALNSGQTMGGPVTVYLGIGQRQAEQIVQDGLNTSALTMRIAKPDPLGAGRYGATR